MRPSDAPEVVARIESSYWRAHYAWHLHACEEHPCPICGEYIAALLTERVRLHETVERLQEANARLRSQ